MSQATEQRMRFVVTLESDGRRDDVDAQRKLEALLHRLKSVYGWKAVSVTVAKEQHDRG